MSNEKKMTGMMRSLVPVAAILLVLGLLAQNSQAARGVSGAAGALGPVPRPILGGVFQAVQTSASIARAAQGVSAERNMGSLKDALLAVGASPESSTWCVDDNPVPQNTASPCNNPQTFTSIQAAINQAASGDIILLAGGTYIDTGNAVATFSIPLTVIGGFPGGTCGNCWTNYGNSTASVIDGQGQRRSVEIQGSITVGLNNFTASNGGILNNTGTASLTTSPASGSVCTLNLSNGGTSNGLFTIASVSAVCFPTGGHILDDGTNFTGSGVMRINGGTVTIGNLNTQSVNADNVEMTSGTLTGVGTFTVNVAMTWNGGTMDGPFTNDPGTTNFANGVTVTMAGTNANKTLHQRTLNNHGSIVVNGTGTGSFRLGNLAVFNNYGSFDIRNNDSVVYDSNGEHPTINNFGTITKSGGSGTSEFGSGFSELVSSGSISVITGTLSIDGGAAGGFNDTITGPVAVSYLATLQFAGGSGSTHNFGPTSSITGAGNVVFNNGLTTIAGQYSISAVSYFNGGTVKFNTTANSDTTSMSGGTLAGDGEYDTNTFLWTGGTMQNGDTQAGITSISATGVMTVAGVSSTKHLTGRVFNNNGHAVVNGTGTGALSMSSQAIFNNTSTATFDIRNNDSVAYGSGSASIFINTGTLLKSGGAGTSTLGNGNLSFENDGVVHIMTGTLSLDGGGTDSGSFQIDARSTLRFNGGTHLLGSSSSITGAGNVTFSAGTANVTGAYNVTGVSSITGGSATARFDSNASMTSALQSNGLLTGTGTIDMIYLTWSGGTEDGPGTTNVDASGILTFTGVSTSKYLSQRTVNSNGLAVMNGTGTGYLYIGNDANFNNNVNALLDIQNNDSVLHGAGSQASFNNTGTVRKSSGAGISTLGSSTLVFNNDGALEVLTGTISLDGGGVSSGSFTMSSQATLRFNGGTHTLQPGSSLTGDGNLTFNAGTVNIAGICNIAGVTNVTNSGGVNFNSDATSAFANLINGVIGGTGIFSVTNTLDWTGGTMSGSGTTSVPAGALLIVDGVNATKHLQERTLNLAGTAYVNGTGTGAINMGSGAVFSVQTGGTFNLQNNDSINYEGGTAPVINNDGTFRKSAGSGTSNVGLSTLVFNNNGLVEVLSGVIKFGPNFNQYSGNTNLNGGDISSSGTLNFLGGQLTGSGAITATVENAADIRPGSPVGVLTVNGPYRQDTAGQLTLELGGSTPGTGFDQLRVLGTATLSGTLNVQVINGYVPTIGASLLVMPYASRSGAFTHYTGLVLSGRSLMPTYNPANFSLVVVAGAVTPTPIPTSTPIPGTPSPTPTGCFVDFVDVHQTDYFYPAVQYLACNNVINGYTTSPPCDPGTHCFKPYNNTTRGQLTKIVVLGERMPINTAGGPHFVDVAVGSTFYDYIETAYNAGLINGYPCGGSGEPCPGTYFRPNALVTRGQLTKIVVLAEGWTLQCPNQGHFSDVPSGSTFYCHIETAYSHGIINGYPDGTFRPGNPAARGQISKIVYLAVTQP